MNNTNQTFTATLTRYCQFDGFTSETLELTMGDNLKAGLPTVKLASPRTGRLSDHAVFQSGSVSCRRTLGLGGVTGEGLRVHDVDHLRRFQLFTSNSR